MNRTTKLAWAVSTLLVAGCATTAPLRTQEPHHYSRDADGNRIACYTTAIANEYECMPLHPYTSYRRRHYDPWWPHLAFMFHYGWPYHPAVYWHPHHRRWRAHH